MKAFKGIQSWCVRLSLHIGKEKKYFISWRLHWIHKCSIGEQGNIFQVFEMFLKGHWKSVFAKKKPLLKNTGHLRPYGRRRKWKWCDCNWIVAASKNTLTHSAAVERFSASVLKSLQSRGLNIEAFKPNGCALGCRSFSGKRERERERSWKA